MNCDTTFLTSKYYNKVTLLSDFNVYGLDKQKETKTNSALLTNDNWCQSTAIPLAVYLFISIRFCTEY